LGAHGLAWAVATSDATPRVDCGVILLSVSLAADVVPDEYGVSHCGACAVWRGQRGSVTPMPLCRWSLQCAGVSLSAPECLRARVWCCADTVPVRHALLLPQRFNYGYADALCLIGECCIVGCYM